MSLHIRPDYSSDEGIRVREILSDQNNLAESSTDNRLASLGEKNILQKEEEDYDLIHPELQGRATQNREIDLFDRFSHGATTAWARFKGMLGVGYAADSKGIGDRMILKSGEYLNSSDICHVLENEFNQFNVLNLTLQTLYTDPDDLDRIIDDLQKFVDPSRNKFGTYTADRTVTIIPLVFNRTGSRFGNHIVSVVINAEDNRVIYYDPKGESSRSFKFRDGRRLTDFLEACNQVLLKGQGAIVENRTQHQSDSHSCGAFVVNFLRKTLLSLDKNSPETFEHFRGRLVSQEEVDEVKMSVSANRQTEQQQGYSNASSSSDDF